MRGERDRVLVCFAGQASLSRRRYLVKKCFHREIQTQGYDRLVTLQPAEQAVTVQEFSHQIADVADEVWPPKRTPFTFTAASSLPCQSSALAFSGRVSVWLPQRQRTYQIGRTIFRGWIVHWTSSSETLAKVLSTRQIEDDRKLFA